MGKIDELIEEIENMLGYDEQTRAAVDLSDVKRWAKYVLEVVRDDLTAASPSKKDSNKLGEE